ncbi:MAG: ATP-binding protein [Verrucomicrobia bacterium]|nr:ATP-binding protein [Verrucomicrobiota bacterium]
MSSHASVAKTLEQLNSLKTTIRDFADREEKLNREFSTESARLRQRLKQTAEERQAVSAAELAKADEFFQAETQRIQSRFDQRKSWISQIHKATKQRRLEQIESEQGRRTFEVQRDLLQTDRGLEPSLQETEAAFEAFTNELAAERESLVVLERRVRSAVRGYGKFRRMLSRTPEVDLAQDHNRLLELFRARASETRDKLRELRRSPLQFLFRFSPLWFLVLLMLLIGTALVPALKHFGIDSISDRAAAFGAAAGLVVILFLYFISRRLIAPGATAIATAFAQARALFDACEQKSVTGLQQEMERIKTEADDRTQSLQADWKQNVRRAAELRAEATIKIDTKAKRALDKNEELRAARLALLEREQPGRVAAVKQAAETRKREFESRQKEQEQQLGAKYEIHWQTLEAEWKGKLQPIFEAISAAQSISEKLFPEWSSASWKDWNPPSEFAHAVKFGRLDVDVTKLTETFPRNKHLTIPGPTNFNLPLLLTFPEQGSLLFETKNSGREQVITALNNIILRLLSVAPPGRVNFSILDPLELGQNFAGIMHLADYEDRLINGRIWTKTDQIEQQLANLNEHIEKVTQMYLRNEYATIAEYNEQAGRIAEKFHFLVVADFPTNFSEVAAKRLLSIAVSGPRCGVYTLIHWDQRKLAPTEFVPEELRKSSVCIQAKGNEFTLAGQPLDGTTLRLDLPPSAVLATEFLHKVGRASIDSNRVEMPFAEVAPPESQLWSEDTTTEIRVPIGRTGATKLQYLALGKGTRQHALIAGKTGSGKSTLFHVMITNLALWCSPDQVEFYLVDFKKGVEFKCYATSRLPHARVVAIESDREFGLSVLQRVDEELKRRGDLFRKLSVQDIAGYKKAGGTEPIPRTLLLIDEFQEFFVEDDRVSQTAALLLDRIVRQGRAFGIHVLLGSQTLGGAYTLARATLGQMVVRIALQCNEADAYLIMDENNGAPRLLSRPGEAIYNDTAGTLEGNSPFQIVWLPDEVRETYLDKVRHRADRDAKAHPAPIVFEGNAPAHVEENDALRRLLEGESIKPVAAPRAWLGAPNSIKGPTEATFKRQSGNNLLIVGQRDEAALALLAVSLVSLAAQHPRGSARFILFDSDPPDSPHRRFLDKVVHAIPHEISFAGNAEVDEIMTGLAQEMEKRGDPEYAAKAPAIYLFIHDLQRFKKLRHEEDFGISTDDAGGGPNPGIIFNKLICEGTSLGFHVICTSDTVNNVNRFLSRKALSEFEMRVLFQMSANDSAVLIDSPKANNLGLHRAIFFNEQEGHLEMFRPYALPENGWIDETGKNLARLVG